MQDIHLGWLWSDVPSGVARPMTAPGTARTTTLGQHHGYMGRKERKFWTGKINVRDREVLTRLTRVNGGQPFTWAARVKTSLCFTYRFFSFKAYILFCSCCRYTYRWKTVTRGVRSICSRVSCPFGWCLQLFRALLLHYTGNTRACLGGLAAYRSPSLISTEDTAKKCQQFPSGETAGEHRPRIHKQKKIESFKRINSIRETNGNFDSCNTGKRLRTSRLHELHESKFPFVSRTELSHWKLSIFVLLMYPVSLTIPLGVYTASPLSSSSKHGCSDGPEVKAASHCTAHRQRHKLTLCTTRPHCEWFMITWPELETPWLCYCSSTSAFDSRATNTSHHTCVCGWSRHRAWKQNNAIK